MPGGDRTGPMGAGPRTGWGMGACAGSPGQGNQAGPDNASAPGFAGRMMRGGRGCGRGFGMGRGFGRGMGRGAGRGWWKNPGRPVTDQPQDNSSE